MARVTQPSWSLRAEELLADGEWHDGLSICREVEKLITPGLALRQAEARRNDAKERVRERRETTLIAMGKRSITQKMVHNRVRSGSWELDPAEPRENAWTEGGWRVRDAASRRLSVRELSGKYRVGPKALRTLILQEPALPLRQAGRIIWIDRDQLPQLEERIQAYKDQAPQRRSAGSARGRETRRHMPQPGIALSVIARELGLAPESAKDALAMDPNFPVERVGRITRVPYEHVVAFGELVEKWRAAGGRGRPRLSPTPHFEDPHLTDLYARYRAGETALREEVFAGMRDAYHSAEEV